MKKTLLLFSIIALVVACGNNQEPSSNPSSTPSTTAENNDPDVESGLQLVAKNDCLTCHKVNDLLVGPSYMDVAAKYKGDGTVIDTLAGRIIKGSEGHWGAAKMTPHPTLSMEDARLMVKYVLSLNQ
ncbi:MAG: c-type cytochrome [Flavisolibacter sp.]